MEVNCIAVEEITSNLWTSLLLSNSREKQGKRHIRAYPYSSTQKTFSPPPHLIPLFAHRIYAKSPKSLPLSAYVLYGRTLYNKLDGYECAHQTRCIGPLI